MNNMNILINYADSKYESARRWNTLTGKLFGKFDKIYEFRPEDIEPSFKEAHKDIFEYERGNGLWLWKPYFIERVVHESEDGDNIFYIDSGAFFIHDPRILLEYISDKEPIFACDQPLLESCWTKPELFDSLNAWQYKHYNQFLGGLQVIRVNEFSRKFYKEWLELCCVHDNISPSGLGKNDVIDHDFGSSFVSHREDQSIFSLLCHLKGITAHRDISQRGKNPESFYSPNYAFKPQDHRFDTYPTIVYLHKGRSLTRFVLGKIYSKLRLGKQKRLLKKDTHVAN